MMKQFLSLLLVLLLTIVSCKESVPPTKNTSETASTVASTKKILPPISIDEIKQLYEVADHVDYIFFDWNFSMNQSDANAVKAAVTFISYEGITEIPESCKAIGHLVFLSKGEFIREADLFFSENCYFYAITDEQGRRTNYNAMTDQGIAFYQKMFAQALNPAPAQ
jgi:hypothetical protein